MPDDEDPDYQTGDYVQLKQTGQQGRIVGEGHGLGFWRVRIEETGEVQDLPEASLEPEY